MYLQGNLQVMFDALYNMGVIDPVLELDWTKELEDINDYMDDFIQIIGIVNSKQHNLDEMIKALESFDKKTLNFLAMEVAREFADFHSREDLH
ncbi:MAG: cytochrome [Bdellovibrionaceae bacterium]|nr:cytochrome [Pseudobdellovibrionaceae bacterium]